MESADNHNIQFARVDSSFDVTSGYTEDTTSPRPAPLTIRKLSSETQSRPSSRHRRHSSSWSRHTHSSRSQGQMSPPLTPRKCYETSDYAEFQTVFHPFLRAYYEFQPTSTLSADEDEASIMVSIRQGDIILVHTVHPNGWADGTLLATGERGWLPTNYCEPYDHPAIHSLLNALTQVWDLARGEDGQINLTPFTKQDYVRGIIAGVRFLLDKSHCLTREALLIQQHHLLHRLRKGLLNDLSAMVKTAKAIQATLEENFTYEAVADDLDTIVAKAFKIVTRAARFLDIWLQETDTDNLEDRAQRPLTPPGNSHPGENRRRTLTDEDLESPKSSVNARDVMSLSLSPILNLSERPTSISHRLPFTQRAIGLQNTRLASQRLSHAHDSFLGHIGSFIGLHLQSRDPAEVFTNTKRSVIACFHLLAVLEEVYARDDKRSKSLEQANDTMYERLRELVKITKKIDCVIESSPDERVIPVDMGTQLVAAATNCVRSAGECVARTRAVIEKIGDFEFERQDLEVDHLFESLGPKPRDQHSTENVNNDASHGSRQSAALLSQTISEKELPPLPSSCSVLGEDAVAGATDSQESEKSAHPAPSSSPLYKLPIPRPLRSPSSPAENSPISVANRSFGDARASASTLPNSFNGDAASIISRASTRATTPDTFPVVANNEPQSTLDSFGNASELLSSATEDSIGVEEQLLEKTFAHELILKEGAIVGGSLPALIEQLTTPDIAPEASLLTAFYMTFRLFTTPVKLAQGLIERFEYVRDNKSIHLRVVHIFKGWLESHWNPDVDPEALGIILGFATGKLRATLPSAGKRLAELVAKVTETRAGAIVPRIGSCYGKKALMHSVFSGPDSALPNPIMPKSQVNALKAFKNGSSQCNVLDFDPLELARQFTLIESGIFISIQPEELLGCEWSKKPKSRAPNVHKMTALSNNITDLVADTILLAEDAKKRALLIKHWIKVAMHCLDLNNYDSVMSIICALNATPIARLSDTWEVVPKKTKGRLDELNAVMDTSRNSATLRQRLQNNTGPCIPFLGMYLTDLTFVHHGNPDTRTLDGVEVINFDKHMKTAKVIGQFQSFQEPYRLTPVPDIQDWVEAQIQRVRSTQPDMHNFYRRSRLLEPNQVRTFQRATSGTASDGTPSVNTARGNTKDRFDFFSNFHFSGMVSRERLSG